MQERRNGNKLKEAGICMKIMTRHTGNEAR